MRNYIIKRLLLIIPTISVVCILVFILMYLIPGDIVDVWMSHMALYGVEIEDPEETRAMLEEKLGLDRSIIHQFGSWLGVVSGADGSFSGVFQGDLGISLRTGRPVTEELLSKWPVTFQLGLMAFLIAQLVALPIGIYSALRQDTWGDYIARSFAIVAISVPGFWMATMAIVLPSIWWGYMPPIMLIPFLEDPIGNLRLFIVPAIILGLLMAGGTMRITRTMMLEVLRQDYIRTAWGKGLRERVVVLRHALKNALIPLVTIIGPQVGIMLGGAVIIETIFSLPGIGRLSLTALEARDYTMVSGTLLIMGLWLMLANLAVDLTYGLLDPRVRYE